MAPDLLAWHLPRDERGKPFLKRRIPLFRYDHDAKRQSHFCLIVATPERRSDRPVIRAEWLQADNQTARLDTARELFDTRVTSQFASVFFGTPASQLRSLRDSSGKSSSLASRIVRSQTNGEIIKACELAGVELDETVHDCLQLRRVTHMCACCAPLDRQLEEWSHLLVRTLVALNLPRVRALAIRDEQLCNRKPRNEPIPILPFPLQRHSRKAHLAVEINETESPRLTIDFTGSGRKLPIPLWKRPVDLDLLRGGVLSIDEFPEGVAEQWGA